MEQRKNIYDVPTLRQYLKKNNIFYETVPMFVTVAVIVMVSGYFIVVNYRIATKVIIYIIISINIYILTIITSLIFIMPR